MRHKRAVFFGLLLGVFFVNVLYAGEYKDINPKELLIDKASLKGKKVMFQDEFIRLLGDAQNLARYLPRFKKYISFYTKNAESCYVEKEYKELVMKLERGDKIIVYGKVDSFSLEHSPERYVFFVDKMERVSDKNKL